MTQKPIAPSPSLTRTLSRASLLFGMCLVSTFICVAPLSAGVYDFTRISSTANVFGNAGPPIPSLNNQGEAAFRASLTSYFDGQGIYKGNGGALTTIFDTTQDPTFWGGFLNTPVINDSGTVAFSARRSGVWGIYQGDGSGLTTVALPPSPFGDYGSPQIANDGTVYFAVSTVNTVAIHSNPVGLADPIFSASTASSSAYLIPSVSDNGTIAFITGGLKDIPHGAYRIDDNSAGSVTPISQLSNLAFNYQSVAVNDAGLVGLVGTISFSNQGVYLGNGTDFLTVADRNGAFDGFGSISLNNLGQFAFSATLDSGFSGIFRGADPAADKVIQTGDALDGSTVKMIEFGSSAFNDRGQVAFYAELTDGRRGVYVATVPEASSLLLASLGIPLAAGYVLCQRRQHRQR